MSLSGGQKAKLQLAKLLLSEANFVVERSQPTIWTFLQSNGWRIFTFLQRRCLRHFSWPLFFRPYYQPYFWTGTRQTYHIQGNYSTYLKLKAEHNFNRTANFSNNTKRNWPYLRDCGATTALESARPPTLSKQLKQTKNDLEKHFGKPADELETMEFSLWHFKSEAVTMF